MISNWLQRVGSSVPRGFSRFYILNQLKETSMTGKQIMEFAAKESDGLWKPSAGLIYPLLGRLLQEGLIEEVQDGKYRITKRGESVLSDLRSIQDVIKKQMDVLMRVGNLGKFIALDVLERVTAMGTLLGENLDKMTKEERDKYRQFLRRELKNLEHSEGRQKVEVE